MPGDQVVGSSESGKPLQQADILVDPVDFPVGPFDLFGVLEINGLKKFNVLRMNPIIDLEKAEAVSVAPETAGDLGRMPVGGKSPGRDITLFNAQGFKVLGLYEIKGVGPPENFWRQGIRSTHFNPNSKKMPV